ncbi:YtxH domain-containing protein [Desulfocastanea catecholica]
MIIKDFIDHVRHAKSERENAARRSKAGMLALGVSIGCTVGAVAGILLAPRSGKETRDDVTLRGSEAWEKIKDNVSTNGHRLVHVLKENGASVGAAVEKESEAVEESLLDLSAKAVKADAKKS